MGLPIQPRLPGGEPLVVRTLADQLGRAGADCSLLGGFDDFVADLPGRLVERLRTGFYSYQYYVRRFSQIRPDVVLGFTDLDASYLRAARSLSIPVVASSHIFWMLCPKWDLFDWKGRLCPGPEGPRCLTCTAHSRKLPWMVNSIGFATRLTLAREVPAFIICPSRYVADRLEHAGHDRRRLVVVPNGIDLERFPFREVEPTRRLLFLGQHTLRKGYPAYVELAQEMREEKLEFVSAGGPGTRDGEGGAVRELGRIPEASIPSLISSAQIVVVPSLWGEPFGLVALEAMATGRPVIAFRSGALSEQVIDGQTGVLVEPGNLDQMRKAVHDLVNDVDRCRALGREGRRSVMGMDVRDMAERYHQVLRRAL